MRGASRAAMIAAAMSLAGPLATLVRGAAAMPMGPAAMPTLRGNPGFHPNNGRTGVRAAKRAARKHRNRLRAKGQHRKAVR